MDSKSSRVRRGEPAAVRVISADEGLAPGWKGKILAGFPRWTLRTTGLEAGASRLDEAVLRCEAEVAVYPAELLAFPRPDGLAIAALVAGPGTSGGHPLEGHLAVVVRRERADLRMDLAGIDVRAKYGMVSLVGATREDLLVPRADRAMRNADIIFYDDLLDSGILGKYRGEKVYVGKRRGRPSARQDEINKRIYSAAVSGRRVVRLKCGDPLIFSRGGEEIRFLRERLVEVEVIPGISSAQVAAASSLIPFTHRGISNRLVFLSGHGIGGKERETLVYFMAASRLGRIASRLVKSGKGGATPAAVIQNAGQEHERIIVTTLTGLEKMEIESPVILVVGEVVRQFQRTERLLFLGPDPDGCRLNRVLVQYPALGRRKLRLDLGQYDGLVFRNEATVRDYFRIYGSIPRHMLIYASGPAAANMLKQRGYYCLFCSESRPDLGPERFTIHL